MGNKKKKGKKHNRTAAAAAAAAASTVTTPVADEQQAAAEEAAYWAYITGGGTVYSSGDACAHSSGAPQQPPAPTPAPAATINGGVVAEHDDDDDDDDDDDCTGTVAVTTTALRGQQPDMVPATSPACGKSSTTGGATAAAAASHHNTTAAAAAVPRRRLRVAEGQVVPYTTFAPTAACVSAIAGAGTGLVTLVQLPAFAWVGLYPGTVSKKINRKLESHTMGSRDNLYIIADPQVQEGVHMVNEASPPAVVNVFYAKLRNGYVLYFAGSEIAAGEELFTCYSRSYGKRDYGIPRKGCGDPRCGSIPKHRVGSGPDSWLPGWKDQLRDAGLALPAEAGVNAAFLSAAGLGRQS